VGDLHEGKTEQALQDLEAPTAVARLNRDDWTLVSQMIRIAVTGFGVARPGSTAIADWTEPATGAAAKGLGVGGIGEGFGKRHRG